MKVHFLHEPDEAIRLHLESRLDPVVCIEYGPVKAPADFELLIAGRPSRQDLMASPALKTLVIPFAGLPGATRDVLRGLSNITVYNLHHNASPTAEMAIALMLAAMKFILPADRGLREGDWTLRYQPRQSRMAEGASALVLGYGAVGRRIAELCLALGMHVTIMARSSQKQVPSGCIYRLIDDLDEVLPRTDVLLVCVPHTEETEGLIEAERLDLLPEHSVVVNVGRGAVLEESALYHALAEKDILAAGLDVWYHYPGTEEERLHTHPSRFPFHELDNVVMSPHMAGGVHDIELRRMEGVAELLNRLARGEGCDEHRVDVDRGY